MNLMTAVTNITAIFPFQYALYHHDTTTAYFIFIAAFSSAISHLFESHKHQMWGFRMDPYWSWILNRVDVISVIMIVARCIWIVPNLYDWSIKNIDWYFIFLSTLALNFVSELDKGYRFYLPLHCMWHILIFLVLHNFLKRIPL